MRWDLVISSQGCPWAFDPAFYPLKSWESQHGPCVTLGAVSLREEAGGKLGRGLQADLKQWELGRARRVGWEESPQMSSGPAEHLGKHARPHDRRDGAAARSWGGDSVMCKKLGYYICDWKRSKCQELGCGLGCQDFRPWLLGSVIKRNATIQCMLQIKFIDSVLSRSLAL